MFLFMELIKKRILMNRWKGNMTTQITLDDDFIVPDTMDDMEQIMMDTGEIQVETVKNQGDKALVKGRLEFQVLYRRESGGLQSLGGNIPFEEIINVPDLEEKDDVDVNWMLEDLSTERINSRKLGVQAIVTFKVRVEAPQETEAATDVDMGNGYGNTAPGESAGDEGEPAVVETMKRNLKTAVMAVRRRDTYRVKEEISLTGGKPNLGKMIWQELKIREVSVKPMDGRLHLEGELSAFIIYEAEEDGLPVQWLEEILTFSGDMEMSDVKEEQIPMIAVRLTHKDMEAKPDYDGEMREIEIEAVLELDIRLYEERETELLSDLYSNSMEILPERKEAFFDQLLTRNVCRTKAAEKFKLPENERILQICRSEGNVKLDEVEPGQDTLEIDGVLEVTLLYLTSEDDAPIQSVTEQLPFHCSAEARGIRADSVYQLNAGLEQLNAVMTGGDMVEVKAVIALEILVLQPVCEPVITGVATAPLDLQKLEKLPGIVGYIVQPEDSLWTIAKKFHTTMGTVISANELSDAQVKPGQRLLLVKEVAR